MTTTSNYTFTFPIAFSTTNYFATFNWINNTSSTSNGWGDIYQGGRKTTGCKFITDSGEQISIIAIGY